MNPLGSLAKAAIRPLSRGRLLIFTYHRVLEQRDELLPGEPDAQEFAFQVELIARHLRVMPLSEAVRCLEQDRLPRCAACITFDDGYRNNFDIAVPILKRHGLTATFFIATGAVEQGSMFNDRIIEAVRRTSGRLDLEQYGLGVWDCSTPGTRAQSIGGILDRIKYEPHDRRERLSWQIYQEVAGGERLDLMMSPAMIRALAGDGFELGGHTVNHPILARLGREQALKEIAESRRWIQDVSGVAPPSFAYPNGRPGRDFLPEHARMVKEVGFTCAVTTEWAVAKRSHDRFALPRLTPVARDEQGWLAQLARSFVGSWVPRAVVQGA